jgi:hypothetical protein
VKVPTADFFLGWRVVGTVVHTQRLALGRGRYGQLTSSSSSLRANEEGSLAAPLSFVVILWYLPVHAAIMACLRCSCLRPTHHALSRSAPHTKCVVQLCGCCEVWCVRLPFVLKGGGAHRRAVAKPRARRFGCERVVMHCGVWCVGVWAVTATDTQSRKLHTNSLGDLHFNPSEFAVGITQRKVSLKKIRLKETL